MPRLAFIAVLAVLAAAAPAQADATRDKILRECQNGSLTGDYTAREIRDARSNIPDDLDQYTDCRDVLTRALLDLAGGGSGGGGGDAGTAGIASTGGGSGGGAGGGAPLTPSTEADREALEQAGAAGAAPVEVSGRNVTPGNAALRNDLPATLIVLLALLAAAAVAAAAPIVWRRALAPLVSLGPAIRRRVLPGRPG